MCVGDTGTLGCNVRSTRRPGGGAARGRAAGPQARPAAAVPAFSRGKSGGRSGVGWPWEGKCRLGVDRKRLRRGRGGCAYVSAGGVAAPARSGGAHAAFVVASASSYTGKKNMEVVGSGR